MKLAFALFTLILFTSFVYGQKGDSNFVANYRDDISLGLFYENEGLGFKVKDRHSPLILDYKPNNNQRIGLGFNYKFFGIRLGTNRPFSSQELETKGKTESFDFRTTIFLRKVTFELLALKYDGFYIKNTKELWPKWKDGDYFKRPDLQAFSVGFNNHFIFNGNRYSMRSIISQNEGQKKSAGSFLLKYGFRYLHLKSDLSLIPRDFHSQFAVKKETRNIQFRVIGIASGYGHTFVIRGFYLALGLLPGITLQQHVMVRKDDSRDYRFAMNVKLQSWGGIGYDSHRFFVGVVYTSDVYYFRLRNSKFNFGVNELTVRIGTRF